MEAGLLLQLSLQPGGLLAVASVLHLVLAWAQSCTVII